MSEIIPQEQIDRICTEVLGWQKERLTPESPWFWAHDRVWTAWCESFNPFTNPSDCKVVMDEVEVWEIASFGLKPRQFRCTLRGGATYALHHSTGETWTEAFCNALLEALGRG